MYLESYLNKPSTKRVLGVPNERRFVLEDDDVEWSIVESGDAAQDASELLVDMVNDGLRLLVFVGNAG